MRSWLSRPDNIPKSRELPQSPKIPVYATKIITIITRVTVLLLVPENSKVVWKKKEKEKGNQNTVRSIDT